MQIGGTPADLPFMDGMSIWQSLKADKVSPRAVALHNIDDYRGIEALTLGDWKYMKGNGK